MAKACQVGPGCGRDGELTETYQTDEGEQEDVVCRAHSGRYAPLWPMTGQTTIERTTDATD